MSYEIKTFNNIFYLRIRALRRRKHLYQTASGDKEVEERPFLSQQ